MKTNGIFKAVALAAMMCIMAISAHAQSDRRISREQLATRQAEYIAKQLNLDDHSRQKLIDVYKRCQQEVWELGPRIGKKALAGNEKPAQNRLERSQKLLDIRKKYYQEYSTFLTDEQIDSMYRMEMRMMKHMGEQKRKPNRRK